MVKIIIKTIIHGDLWGIDGDMIIGNCDDNNYHDTMTIIIIVNHDGHDDYSFLRQSTCAGRGCFAETSTGCGLSLITE